MKLLIADGVVLDAGAPSGHRAGRQVVIAGNRIESVGARWPEGETFDLRIVEVLPSAPG